MHDLRRAYPEAIFGWLRDMTADDQALFGLSYLKSIGQGLSGQLVTLGLHPTISSTGLEFVRLVLRLSLCLAVQSHVGGRTYPRYDHMI